MMKAKEQRNQLRNFSKEEIAKKVAEMQEELFNLRFQAKMGQLANALQLRMVRRNIARAMTIMAQKTGQEKPAVKKPAQEKTAKKTAIKTLKKTAVKPAAKTAAKTAAAK
jgi:large subunit ribosomal protein L29